VLDHALAAAEHLIPNSAWQLAKAIFTRQPIKVPQPAACAAPMEEFNMLNLSHLEKFVVNFEKLVERIAVGAATTTKVLAPIAEAVAPVAGDKAGAVNAGAELADKAADLVLEHAASEQDAAADKAAAAPAAAPLAG
jgi:hypothetical protein